MDDSSTGDFLVIHPRKVLTHRNPQEEYLLFTQDLLHNFLSRGGRRPLLFVCLLRCSNFELIILITIFSSLCGIGKREVIGKSYSYQYIFRRNSRDITKIYHLVHSVFLTNKIVLNAAEGKGSLAKIIGIPRQSFQ